MSSAPVPSKAEVLRALQQRVAELEKARTPTPTATPSASPPPARVAPAASAPAPLRASASLEEMKALLAAKIAAKERAALGATAGANGKAAPAAPRSDTPPATLSAAASPFVPSAASTAASFGSAAASSTPAVAASSRPTPNNQTAPVKTQLCRAWLTCTFGTRCRFKHPTVDSDAFFEYGGRVLLHLNASAIIAAANVGATGAPAPAVPTIAMPPVLLLALAIMVQSRADPSQSPSMSLSTLLQHLRDQLVGSRDVPSSQDDLLNSMGLPTTAAVLVRAAEGQPVMSTDAFRNMYASVFSVTRREGTFHVAHQWDESRRAQLQAAAEGAETVRPSKPRSNGNGGARNPTPAADEAEADLIRKRKRIPDSALADGERHAKSSRAGEAYPEDGPVALPPATVASKRPSAAMTPGSVYSLDAGAQLGGATAFVRGGIVTELSLLAPAAALREQAALQQSQRVVEDPFEDAFTRAIRRQREVSTHATYTVHTNRIASGKGFDMLQKMNWRNGQGLGKRQQGRVDPLEVKFRADRTGL